MYSWARWTGLRVWKPTTRFQPLSANAARSSRGIVVVQGEAAAVGRLQKRHLAAQQDVSLAVQGGDAGVSLVRRPVDLRASRSLS